VACLSLYLKLQNWKRQGTNLTALALNIAVTFVMLGILLIAIITFYSRNKKLAEKLRHCELTGPVAGQLKKVGKLESLAGRADRLGSPNTSRKFGTSSIRRKRPCPIRSDFGRCRM
jgi:hypothetical protein